ncbi:MAG: protease inhibitor I42 family protein [Dehalococcoidales bacterium]|nr:protease inhibitor I42 family protein [Dehalococcoidales bacterium]
MGKRFVVLVAVAAMASLVLSGCSPAGSSAPGTVSVDESSSGKQVEIAAGGTLTVTLESNATTGFQWELKSVGDPAVLQSQGGTYNAPEDTGVVGAGGEEVWTFKALKAGTSSLSMEYSQPWEGGTKAAQTFSLTVVVK